MLNADENVGKDASEPGSVVLLRHGQTAWSVSGQYTGRTNIPLTEQGMIQARQAGVRLRQSFPHGFEKNCVYVSPLKRALQTAQQAGFDQPLPMPEIMEWDYGHAEGQIRQDLSKELGRDWDVWSDGPAAVMNLPKADREEVLPGGEHVQVHVTSGESLQEVAERVDKAIAAIAPQVLDGKDVILIAHAHVLRILAVRWLGLDPVDARLLRMYTAHFGVLGFYKGDRVLKQWNC